MTFPPFIEVAYVDDREVLWTLSVTEDAVPAARQRGWMVWTDFQEPPTVRRKVDLRTGQSNPRRRMDP